MCFFKEEEDILWAGTNNNGIYQFHLSSLDEVLCLYQDSQKGIWAGVEDAGILKYSKKKSRFEQ